MTNRLWPGIVVCLAALAPGVVPAASASPSPPSPESAAHIVLAVPARETEPVVLTGASFGDWAVPADVTLKAPGVGGKFCEGGQDEYCTHNTYEDPDFSSDSILDQSGTPIEHLLGYQWTGTAFRQVPFQVDEMFQHYISNNNSGFAFYSETDQHLTYVFDREGFRWTGSDPSNPCLARPVDDDGNLVDPKDAITPDPVTGLDTDDEVVFMASDAGVRAPETARLPWGTDGAFEVEITDPFASGQKSYLYVMRAVDGGAKPKFDDTNGYVHYERDANADRFLFSESSYENYGAAAAGPWYDPATGICHSAEADYLQHRPGDEATITTPRYKFRYEGRWMMTELHVSAADDGEYGPDLIDQWKARAFQQRPSGQTPCCGYEEEVNNWGGSSILMGELSGPVRTIRETWGADSGTNVVRREIFYRDEIRFGTFLRVHVIPPLDGIYAQWDYNATTVSTYFNPFNPDGVPIDGKNDEVFGNSRVHAGPDGVSYDGDDAASEEIKDKNGGDPVTVGDPNEPGCKPMVIGDQYDGWNDFCVYNDIDSPDPTFSGVVAGLNWEEIAGPNGTIVTRSAIKQFTPGGSVQGIAAVPYYRDDACFDDGTGSNPGPHIDGRSVDDGEDSFYTDASGTKRERECWDSDLNTSDPAYAADLGTSRFYQGSIGTHGVHLLLIAESDNAGTTVPVTEVDSEQRMVVLRPTLANVGEEYGRQSEKPLVAAAAPATLKPAPAKQTSSLEMADASGRATDPVTLSATLKDEAGEPLGGQTVSFTYEGATQETTTEANGVASVTVVPAAGGAKTAVVDFAGTPTIESSHDDATVTANPEITVLDLDDPQLAGGQKTVDLRATLLTDDSEPVSGRVVSFTDGLTTLTGTTDSNGIATAQYTVPKGADKKETTITATWSGDATYASSTDSAPIRKAPKPHNPRPQPAPRSGSLPVPPGAVIVSISAAAWWLILKAFRRAGL